MEVAADADAAAAGGARGVELRPVLQPDQIAGDIDSAADYARGVERARHLDQTVVAAGEHDRPLGIAPDRLRFDDPAAVDERIDHALGRLGGQEHAPALGGDAAVIADEGRQRIAVRTVWRLRHLAVQGQRHQPVAVEIEGEGGAGAKADFPQLGFDHAGIGDARRDQRGEAALGHRDVALVDDRAALRRAFEAEAVVEEVTVGDIRRGGDEAADIDLGIRPEQDAVLVEQQHIAVGVELSPGSPRGCRR